jgi:hypothetical protein
MTPVDVISIIVGVGGFAEELFILLSDFILLNSAANLQSTINVS